MQLLVEGRYRRIPGFSNYKGLQEHANMRYGSRDYRLPDHGCLSINVKSGYFFLFLLPEFRREDFPIFEFFLFSFVPVLYRTVIAAHPAEDFCFHSAFSHFSFRLPFIHTRPSSSCSMGGSGAGLRLFNINLKITVT